VHTIGKGLLLAEIQETSDITYRIYDFDRVDDQGNKRELHTEEALAAIDYKQYPAYKTPYTPQENDTVNLVASSHFTTNLVHFDHTTQKDYSHLDSFVIHVCLEGAYDLTYNGAKFRVQAGECLLLPNTVKKVQLNTQQGFKILESYIA
jgi:mannose-6-phosphate isomerase